MTQDDQLPLDDQIGPRQDGTSQTLPAPSSAHCGAATDDVAESEPASTIDAQGAEAAAETSAPVTDAPVGAPDQAEALGTEDAAPVKRDQVDVSDELAPKVTGGTISPTAPREVYFLTNRMNLNGILSSRIVAPRESHAKYYMDLLDRAPGWVPLLTHPPTSALIEAVTTERGAGAPVLIEFSSDIVEAGDLDGPVAYLPAVAFSQAAAIHFRQERDLREHRARGYKNVHLHDELLKVTPELFASEATTDFPLTPPPLTRNVDWQRIDRVRGAVNAAVASVESGEQLAAASAFLGSVRFPAAIDLPEWLNWREIDDHDSDTARIEADLEVPDHIGFRVAYEVLGEQDVTQAWSPSRILDAVATRIAAAGLAPDRGDAMIQNLQRVRSIVNVEADFEPFRPTARALVSAKALLLVLLRPELEELLAWPEEETGADDLTRVTAAVLAGRLRGLARESTSLRTRAMDDLTAAWAVRIAQGGQGGLGKVQYSANSRGASLKIDGVELAAGPALLPDLVAKYGKLPEAKKEPARIKVSRALGWPVTHRIEIPAAAAVTSEEAAITIATHEEIAVVASVDENDFVNRLAGVSGGIRRRALEAFDLRKR